MSRADRRDILKLALGASLIPLLASRAASANATGTITIAPPVGSMLYRRRLERGLPGGASFSVTREFRVSFEPVPSGFRLNGFQLSAHVDAPESLDSFATLEEQRVETGMFPLLFDATGKIMEGNGELPGNEVEQALRDARARLQAGGGQDQNEVAEFVEALHKTGTRLTAHLPEDLFAPVQTLRSDRREIALPWGDHGEVTTRFQANRDPQTHLMRHASREVVTRMGDDMRHSLEGWDLLPD